MSLRAVLIFGTLLTFILGISGNFETDWKYIKLCNITSPITMRTLNDVLINKKLEKSESSSNFKCFLHCLFTQYSWMDEEGGFELHSIRQMLEETGSLEPPILEYVMFTCTALRSVDKCERAFLFTECFWTKTTEETTEEDKFFYSLEDKKK